MKKRGISPLIATVLLVGIAVVLATVLMIFLRGVTDDQTTRSEDKLFLGQVCLENVDIEYDSFCFWEDATDNYINITIKNKEEIPIEEFGFKVIGNEIKVTNRQDQLDQYTTRTYNMSVDLSDISDPENTPLEPRDDKITNIEILIKKKIDYSGVTGYCDDDELNINIIYHCSKSELPPP
ncbi:MAG: archaellin/type IV pilin N-terminal domain-containing protein [Candidatus Woesearchaeota archaeon]